MVIFPAPFTFFCPFLFSHWPIMIQQTGLPRRPPLCIRSTLFSSGMRMCKLVCVCGQPPARRWHVWKVSTQTFGTQSSLGRTKEGMDLAGTQESHSECLIYLYNLSSTIGL
jgi:hypothetical protein